MFSVLMLDAQDLTVVVGAERQHRIQLPTARIWVEAVEELLIFALPQRSTTELLLPVHLVALLMVKEIPAVTQSVGVAQVVALPVV